MQSISINEQEENNLEGEVLEQPETQAESAEEQTGRYKDGQVLTFVRVRFPSNARSFPFFIGNRKFPYGKRVVAMSDRGMAVGYINSFPYKVTFNKSMLPIRNILKVATDSDLDKDLQNYQKEKGAREICRQLVEKHKLDMDIVNVEYTQFGKKAVFYFISPARVDFRELVKDLVSELKMRIELRQISMRDRTAALGGLGPCGRQLCCSSFLEQYGHVNIKMAKNQNLMLNANKINGLCGQLKCCIAYEDEVYSEKRSHLPQMGEIVATKNGDVGRVERLHILAEQFETITKDGIKRRYVLEQYLPEKKNEQLNFPSQFEHIVDETSQLIGANVINETPPPPPPSSDEPKISPIRPKQSP